MSGIPVQAEMFEAGQGGILRVVVFHVAGCVGFKKTVAKDDEPKSRIANTNIDGSDAREGAK